MSNIGVVFIGHSDYLGEVTDYFKDKITEYLRKIDSSVYVYDAICCDESQSRAAAKDMLKNEVSGVIVCLTTWIECPTAFGLVKCLRGLPFALLGVPMFDYKGREESTGSYVSYAMFKGVLDRLEIPFVGLLYSFDDPRFPLAVDSFIRAIKAMEKMENSKIGLFGYTSMSIYTGTFDHLLLRHRIGAEVEQADTYSLINEADKVSKEEAEDALKLLKNRACVAADIGKDILFKTMTLYVALKKIIAKKGWNAVNLKCQYELSKEYKAVPCVPLSLLADKNFTASCEGDILNTVGMMLLQNLSGKTTGYGDVISHRENKVRLSSCGFIPFEFSAAAKEAKVTNFMPHDGFTGIQCGFCPPEGKVTVMRLIEDKFDYHILYFTGNALKTPLRQGYMPAMDVEPDGEVEKLAENYNGQHFAFCMGDFSREIETYAKLNKIKTVRI